MKKEFINRMRRIYLNNKMEFSDLSTTFSMSQAAEILNIKKIGRNKLYSLLEKLDIIGYYKQVHDDYIEKGYFTCQIQENSFNQYVTRISQKV